MAVDSPAEYWLKHKELKANFLTVLQVKTKATRQKQILKSQIGRGR